MGNIYNWDGHAACLRLHPSLLQKSQTLRFLLSWDPKTKEIQTLSIQKLLHKPGLPAEFAWDLRMPSSLPEHLGRCYLIFFQFCFLSFLVPQQFSSWLPQSVLWVLQKSKTEILSAWLLHSSPASASTLYSRVFFTWPVAKISCGFVLHRFFCFAVSLSKLFQMVSSLCLHVCFLSRVRGCDFRFCMLLLSLRGLSLRHATLALLYIVTSGVLDAAHSRNLY